MSGNGGFQNQRVGSLSRNHFHFFLYPYIPWVTKNTICPIYLSLGIGCPGCGITRSFSCLLHGHIAQSINYHPLGIPLDFGLIYLYLRQLTELVRKRPLPVLLSAKGRTIVGHGLLVALISSWLIKIAAIMFFMLTLIDARGTI